MNVTERNITISSADDVDFQLNQNITRLQFRATNATQNQINATGQNNNVSAFNISNFANFAINISLNLSITNDPFREFIIDSEWQNWTVLQNQSFNFSGIQFSNNASILCADIQ